MHQTTVRFTSDLWSRLEQEAERTGVSAAQYVRDATLARMERSAVAPAPAAVADEVALALPASTDAVRAQAQLARERARSLRMAAKAAAARRPQGRIDA